MGVFFNFNLGGECARWGATLVIRAISTCSNEIIISTKEARKLLGKADSDKISDLELALVFLLTEVYVET